MVDPKGADMKPPRGFYLLGGPLTVLKPNSFKKFFLSFQ
jgi:hypothetical protein